MKFNSNLAAVAALVVVNVNAQGQPLLTTIAGIQELSSFSNVLNATGGGKPNPAFEERFNSPLDGRNFTAIVPSNEAFDKVAPAVLAALTNIPAYDLLEAIIRTHLAEGAVPSSDILNKSIRAIEGFMLTATADGNDIYINNQGRVTAVDTIASNGIIHQIDQVLNPFTGLYGVSNSTSSPSAATTNNDTTISQILASDDRLSTAHEVLLNILPDLATDRLNMSGAGGTPQIFVVPSNDAFSVLPSGSVASMTAPSNAALSSLLFEFGLLDTNITSLDLSNGPVSITSASTGLNLTATQTDGGATMLNNAALQASVCGANGCVWIVDRLLDPLYLSFGPLTRSSSTGDSGSGSGSGMVDDGGDASAASSAYGSPLSMSVVLPALAVVYSAI